MIVALNICRGEKRSGNVSIVSLPVSIWSDPDSGIAGLEKANFCVVVWFIILFYFIFL
jgi:hypothetical protein